MAELLVITNADDFGLSHEVNAAVELLHQKGVLSSATIMANGSALDEVKAIHDRNPELGLGVHLNATNFRALTPAMRQSVLCDESGSFASNFRTEHRLSMTGLLAQEWLAQVTRFARFRHRPGPFGFAPPCAYLARCTSSPSKWCLNQVGFLG